jgi:succinate dehydrogenase hydrophobic anchor subunit
MTDAVAGIVMHGLLLAVIAAVLIGVIVAMEVAPIWATFFLLLLLAALAIPVVLGMRDAIDRLNRERRRTRR